MGRRSVAQRLEGGEACERGGEFVSPGPVGGDADEHPAPAAGDAGGDVQQPLAQRLRLASGEVAVQQDGLGPGDQIAGGQGELSQTALIANSRDGKRPSPVCLPQRMRSSTVAWPRWRASSAASCPIGVSVAKAWNRQPLMSVKDSWAPGLRAFAAHDHPHPLGPTGGGQVGKHAGQLGHIGAGTHSSVGVDGRGPRRLGQRHDGLLNPLGHGEPDRERQVQTVLITQRSQMGQQRLGGAGAVGADQDRGLSGRRESGATRNVTTHNPEDRAFPVGRHRNTLSSGVSKLILLPASGGRAGVPSVHCLRGSPSDQAEEPREEPEG